MVGYQSRRSEEDGNRGTTSGAAAVAASFSHAALFYRGLDEFSARVGSYASEALQLGAPTLVAVSTPKIDVLRRELGHDASRVTFVDIADIGRNPARMIPLWVDFVGQHPGASPPRGVSEPVWHYDGGEGSEHEFEESLLDLAFDSDVSWSLLCPFDVATLPSSTIDRAREAHDHESRARRLSGPQLEHLGTTSHPLPLPPSTSDSMEFDLGTLRQARSWVASFGRGAGLEATAEEALVMSAGELMINSVMHGGGDGTVTLWADELEVVCDVHDAGHMVDPMVGRRKPLPRQLGNRGLWIVNQLCDLVQIRSDRRGTTVRAHVRRQLAATT